MSRTTYVHVNQHVIKANRTKGETNPPLTVKDYTQNRKAHEAIIRDAAGNEAARVVYRPESPLSCGAHVWIETKNQVDVLTTDEEVEAEGTVALSLTRADLAILIDLFDDAYAYRLGEATDVDDEDLSDEDRDAIHAQNRLHRALGLGGFA